MIIKIDLYDFFAMHRKYELDVRDELNRLGITWKRCEHDPMTESVVFTGCSSAPKDAPSYMKFFPE